MSDNLPNDEQLTAEEAMARIRQAIDKGSIGFQCVFCRESIDDGACALILVTNWDGAEDKQREQQWFCHPECFIKATGERIDVLETQA